MGAYVGAARRRVHLATVLRPVSGHRPGKRLSRHAHILQIDLHLTQPRSMKAATRHAPAPRIPTRQDPVGGILCRETRQMPVEAQFASSLADQQVVVVMVACYTNQILLSLFFMRRCAGGKIYLLLRYRQHFLVLHHITFFIFLAVRPSNVQTPNHIISVILFSEQSS